jgi:hypothetical protein
MQFLYSYMLDHGAGRVPRVLYNHGRLTTQKHFNLIFNLTAVLISGTRHRTLHILLHVLL